jgi:hypothetical protein
MIPLPQTITGKTLKIIERPVETGIDCSLDHTPNDETAAAIEEGRAILRDRTAGKSFNSFEEFWADLNS